jgi:hypothetical protein
MSRIDPLQAFRQVWTPSRQCWQWDRWPRREIELFVTGCSEIVAGEQVRGANESDPPAYS